MLHNKRYEREYASMMCSQGFHCERIAGSGSARDAVCDCILFKEGIAYLVEVKATKYPVFYSRAYVREQLGRMQSTALKQQVHALLAIKFKNRGWKQLDITEKIPEVIKWQ